MALRNITILLLLIMFCPTFRSALSSDFHVAESDEDTAALVSQEPSYTMVLVDYSSHKY